MYLFKLYIHLTIPRDVYLYTFFSCAHILHLRNRLCVTVHLSKQCEIFASRFVPETTPRDVVGFLKSKYDVNVQVMQMRTKFDAYTSFKITAPSYLKRDLLNRTNWISGTYVREFVGRLN